MKIFNKTKKIITTMLLISAFSSYTLPVVATTITTSGDVLSKDANGNYGAHVNSMTNGAYIDTDLTNANIHILGNGSTITWQDLNIAKGQKLNFDFTKSGQVALNNVVGTSMSRVAGQMTSSGQTGRIIISNKNGMIFENGSRTIVDALTLTTKDVIWDGNKNGQIELKDNGSKSTIAIGDGAPYTSSRLDIAGDLNIVAYNIKLDSGDLRGRNIKLITTDGVTFLANSSNHNLTVANSNTENVDANIDIQNSHFSLKDSSGKVYLLAKGDIKTYGVQVRKGSLIANAVERTRTAADGQLITDRGDVSIQHTSAAQDITVRGKNLTIQSTSSNNLNAIAYAGTKGTSTFGGDITLTSPRVSTAKAH